VVKLERSGAGESLDLDVTGRWKKLQDEELSAWRCSPDSVALN